MIRRLGPSDADALMAFRRHALESAPLAFESGPDDDRLADPAFTRDMLLDPEQGVFGALDDGTLVGMVGVRREERPKTAHRCFVWGLFVEPHARSRGRARALMREALRFAASLDDVTSVHLTVGGHSPHAEALYRSLGFLAWGVDPDALRVDGVVVAETHMVLRLDRP